MESPTATTPCEQHRRRSSVAGCAACGKRVCTDCLVHTPVGIKCRRCTSGPKRPPPRRTVRQPRPASRRRFGLAAVVVGLVVVAGVAFTLLRDGQPDEPVAEPVGAETNEPREIAVTFDGADGLPLRGTLRVPEGASEPLPGVVIIPGFGPTTRDGVLPPAGIPDPLYRDVSGALAEAGVASLRYDKRGTGESPLDEETVRRFDDMVEDAAAALTFLAERAEIDPDALALVGHDEGGLTALRVAAADPRVTGLVLLSTPGRPLVDVLADDFVASAEDPAQGEEHAQELRTVVSDLLETGRLPDPNSLRTALRPVFPPGEEAYLRELFSIDPAQDAADVDAPALIVRGDRDPGVSAEDVDLLAEALGGDTEVLVGEQAGHTLALDDAVDEGGETQVTGDAAHDRGLHTGTPSGIERDDALLEQIAAWVTATLGADAAPPTAETGDAVTVRVAASGMAYDPDEHHLPAGRYEFVFSNDDDTDHELQLAVAGEHDEHFAGVGPIAPGESASFVVELEAGEYEMACHLPGHFEAGMVGTVSVR